MPKKQPKRQKHKREAEKFCSKCKKRVEKIYGFSRDKRIRIYQWVLMSLIKAEEASSNVASEVLALKHEDVLMAMQRMSKEFSEYFYLQEDRERCNGPIEITQLGRDFVEFDLAGKVQRKNGLKCCHFRKKFSREQQNLFENDLKWVKSTSQVIPNENNSMVPGSDIKDCQQIHNFASRLVQGCYLSAYECHRLIDLEMAAFQSIAVIYRLKKTDSFPTNRTEVTCLFEKMADSCLHYLGDHKPESS